MGVIPVGASGPSNYAQRFATGASGSDRLDLPDRDENSVKAVLSGDVKNLADDSFGSFFNSLFSALASVFTGVGGLGNSVLSDLQAFFSGKWNQVDELKDGQGSLLDRVDLLSPLQDYGAAYCPKSVNTGWSGGEFKIAYTEQIGPMKNVAMDGSGGLILAEEGLWDVRARMGVGAASINGQVEWEIRVYPPDRSSIFSVLTDYANSTSQVFREMSMPIVVPGPGYRVEVWVTYLTNNRVIQSGSRWTRLSAQHISKSTTHQIEEQG